MKRIHVDFNEIDTWFNRMPLVNDGTFVRGEKITMYDADGNVADGTVFQIGEMLVWVDLDKFYPAVVD